MEIPTKEDFNRLEQKVDLLLQKPTQQEKSVIKKMVDTSVAKEILGGCSDGYLKGLRIKGVLKKATKIGGRWIYNTEELQSLIP